MRLVTYLLLLVCLGILYENHQTRLTLSALERTVQSLTDELYMSDQLKTPLTFTKNSQSITTDVITTRQEGESDEDFFQRHQNAVDAKIAFMEGLGWTLVNT